MLARARLFFGPGKMGNERKEGGENPECRHQIGQSPGCALNLLQAPDCTTASKSEVNMMKMLLILIKVEFSELIEMISQWLRDSIF